MKIKRFGTKLNATLIACIMATSSFCVCAETEPEYETKTDLIPLEEYTGSGYEKEFTALPDKGNYFEVYIDNRNGENEISIAVEESNGVTMQHSPSTKGKEYTIMFSINKENLPETFKLKVKPINYSIETVNISVRVSQVFIEDESVPPSSPDSYTDNVILINLCEYIGTDFSTFFSCSDNINDMLNIWIDNSKNDVDIYAILRRDADGKKIRFDIKAGDQMTYTMKTDELMSIAGEWKMNITTEQAHNIDIFVKIRQYRED